MRKSLIFFFVLMALFVDLDYHRGQAAFLQPIIGDSETHGFDVSNMDRSTSACTNFFQYEKFG